MRIPPINIEAADWRKIAKIILTDPSQPSENISAKLSGQNKIAVQTNSPDTFRFVQRTLKANQIPFHTFSLPEDRTLKIVIKGIPTNITEEEITNELSELGFNIKTIKRFGQPNKPLPIVLVIITKDATATQIYEVNNLFYLKVKIESFRKTGPSQCHACQRFGHGSQNCGHPPRCVKCAKPHPSKECTKPREVTPTCVNCGGGHTANYRGCPYYEHIVSISTPSTRPKTSPQTTTLNTQDTNSLKNNPTQTSSPTNQASYANTLKSNQTHPEPTNSTNTKLIVNILKELLITISTTDNFKDAIISTIKTFLTQISTQNE